MKSVDSLENVINYKTKSVKQQTSTQTLTFESRLGMFVHYISYLHRLKRKSGSNDNVDLVGFY